MRMRWRRCGYCVRRSGLGFNEIVRVIADDGGGPHSMANFGGGRLRRGKHLILSAFIAFIRGKKIRRFNHEPGREALSVRPRQIPERQATA